MPDIIQVLPDSVANQIAAGEVVQRPASAVKELMENALDAGANKITVNVRDGGKTLIQIIDNGCGMSETDARMAFERHATSKIRKADDLFAIRTMGFRGEALASIAAIAQLELKTKRHEDELGTQIRIHGTIVESHETVNCPAGSNFIIKNLFFNVPARRKFLKKDATEFKYILTEFQRVAIANPEISMHLKHNDEEVIDLPATQLRQRIIGVFGKNINQHLLKINIDSLILKFHGYIASPKQSKKRFGEQFFFVNKRFVKHPFFHRVIVEAFENLLAPETIPSYFLFFEIDTEKIDINIHPTKTEIKFEDEYQYYPVLKAAVRECLGKFNITPSLDFSIEHKLNIPVQSTSTKINSPSVKVNPDFNPFEINTEKKHFDKTEIPSNWESLYEGINNSNEKSEKLQSFETNTNSTIQNQQFIQITNKYIIVPVKSGMMIIDQKRAHERILFEQYQKNTGKQRPIQKLLFPQILDFNQEQLSVFYEIEDDLKLLGFEFNNDENLQLISSPGDIDGLNAPSIISQIIDDFSMLSESVIEKKSEQIAKTMAKAASMPYGRILRFEEMENLVNSLFACKLPNISLEGKLVVSILKEDEIARLFTNTQTIF